MNKLRIYLAFCLGIAFIFLTSHECAATGKKGLQSANSGKPSQAAKRREPEHPSIGEVVVIKPSGVFSAPEDHGDPIGIAEEGERIHILEERNGWYRFSSNRFPTGWLPESCTEIRGAFSIPVEQVFWAATEALLDLGYGVRRWDSNSRIIIAEKGGRNKWDEATSNPQSTCSNTTPAFIQTLTGVFSGPGFTFDRLGFLDEHTRIQVIEDRNGWYRFSSDRFPKGWVHSSTAEPVPPSQAVAEKQGKSSGDAAAAKTYPECPASDSASHVTRPGLETPTYDLTPRILLIRVRERVPKKVVKQSRCLHIKGFCQRKQTITSSDKITELGVRTVPESNNALANEAVDELLAHLNGKVIRRMSSVLSTSRPDSVLGMESRTLPDAKVVAVKEFCLVYSGPGSSYERLGTLSGGNRISILEEQGGWYRFSSERYTTGWVPSIFIEDELSPSTPTKAIIRRPTGVFSGPGGSFDTLGFLDNGTVINVLEEQGGWYRFSSEEFSSGWVRKSVTRE